MKKRFLCVGTLLYCVFLFTGCSIESLNTIFSSNTVSENVLEFEKGEEIKKFEETIGLTHFSTIDDFNNYANSYINYILEGSNLDNKRKININKITNETVEKNFYRLLYYSNKFKGGVYNEEDVFYIVDLRDCLGAFINEKVFIDSLNTLINFGDFSTLESNLNSEERLNYNLKYMYYYNLLKQSLDSQSENITSIKFSDFEIKLLYKFLGSYMQVISQIKSNNTLDIVVNSFTDYRSQVIEHFKIY